MKRCSQCGLDKPFSKFPIKRRSKDGRAAACKLCVSEKGFIARKRKRNLRAEAEASHLGFDPLAPLATPHLRHVILSRLLHRILEEVYGRGYLRDRDISNSSGMELRVQAALSVSKIIQAIKDPQCPTTISTSLGDSGIPKSL